MAFEDVRSEVDIVVGEVVRDTRVNVVLVTALGILLALSIFAHCVAILQIALVEYFCSNMSKSHTI